MAHEGSTSEGVGVDTGGTFTDVVYRDSEGRLKTHKLLSTPADPSRAIADGVGALTPEGSCSPPHIIHGTTVATNALLERKGAKVAFLTTAGLEDLLTLRRQNRPYLYAFDIVLPLPLVGEGCSFGVEERMAYDGSVLRPLLEEGIARALDWLEQGEFEAVAISLLHSYANPSHEVRLVEAILARWPDLHVSVSHQIARVFREYERGSTTTVNAYVGPVMANYLDSLARRLPENAIEILQSHGGRSELEEAARLPVHTVLSGPAGGVVGALEAARQVGIEKIITFDMGGTSTDVSLCDGAASVTTWSDLDGLPLLIPVIDIYTVGAGGGSIAYADAGGALRVGPRSAGAMPGPAAYGRGGRLPTVTDAHVVLGSLRRDRFLGGAMALDGEASEQALRVLAEELGLEELALARGILEVADVTMSRAIKVISLERGYDPGDYTLVAFGGAGGLHACRLADALGMNSVLIPRYPGLLSAWGMLQAPSQRFYETTMLVPLEAALEGGPLQARLRGVVDELAAQARIDRGEVEDGLSFEYIIELRYEGQSFELAIPVDWQPGENFRSDPRRAFAAEHERLYGYQATGRPIELVTVRLRATLIEESPSGLVFRGADGGLEAIESARIGFADGDELAQIIEREGIRDDEEVAGPAIVTEYSGTTVIPRGWYGRLKAGHLLVTRERSVT